jgi:hypothetical protein
MSRLLNLNPELPTLNPQTSTLNTRPDTTVSTKVDRRRGDPNPLNPWPFVFYPLISDSGAEGEEEGRARRPRQSSAQGGAAEREAGTAEEEAGGARGRTTAEAGRVGVTISRVRGYDLYELYGAAKQRKQGESG